MEKSKNWRNSCSVLCHGGAKVKIGIWLDEVGIDVARGKGGGGGGGPGARAPPKEHRNEGAQGTGAGHSVATETTGSLSITSRCVTSWPRWRS
jgi:hypothetical protein